MLSIAALRSLLTENEGDAQTLAVAAIATMCVLGAVFAVSRKERSLKKNGKSVNPRKMPGLPGTLPVLGDLLAIIRNKDRYHTWMLECCKSFNFEPWRLDTPGQPNVVILCDPDQFEDVLTTQFHGFISGEYRNERLATYFGKSIIAVDGESWLRQRKMASHFFSARSLRAYMSNSAKRNLIQVMDIIETKQQQGATVNLTSLIFDFTMQTFVETGLGVKLDWIGSETTHPFEEAIEAAAPFITRRFQIPSWVWKAERFFNVGGEGKLAKYMDISLSWLTEVTNQSLQAGMSKSTTTMNASGEELKSIVELFAEHSREDVDGLRAEDLVDFIQVMVLAARDTTAVALTWFFYEISKSPKVEAKIRAEMASAFPTRVGKKDTYFTPEEARSLIYLEAAIKETLRLNPPTPAMMREAAEDSVVCGDILIRKGSMAMLPVYCAARNPDVWGEDAAVFNPDRWIDPSTGQLKQFSSSKFAAFSSGPRNCIGMSLAMMELRVVIVNLLSRFNFTLDPKHDGSFIIAPLLVMKDPLIMTVSSPKLQQPDDHKMTRSSQDDFDV